MADLPISVILLIDPDKRVFDSLRLVNKAVYLMIIHYFVDGLDRAMNNKIPLLIFLASTSLMVSPASAQQVPSTADVGRTQREIDRQIMPQGNVAPSDLVTSSDIQAPEGSEKIWLTLKSIEVQDAHIIPDDLIRSTYSDLIGQKVSVAQIYGVANKITKLYRDRGYVLSRALIPEQDIKNGAVRLQIVEGFISNYTIQGTPRGATRELNAYAEKLTKSGALTAKNLERYLLLMNDLPGLQVRSVLSPSKTIAGGADMTLVVTQDTFEGSIGADNFGNAFLGEFRGTAGLQFNSLLHSSDQWNGTFLYADPADSELAYYDVGFKHNLGREGTVLGLNASYVRTDPSLLDSLALLDAEGHSFNYSIDLQHPVIRSRQTNLYAGARFDITRNRTDYGPGLSAIETDDSQRILRLNGTLTHLDDWSGYNTAGFEISQGIEMLGGSHKGDAKLSRASGDPSFTKATLELTRLQQISGPWSAFVGINGQLAAQALLASEEFGFGGTAYGRGFDSSEITGDHGLASKIELTYTGQPQQNYFRQYQVFGFYDIGLVWNKDPGTGQSSRESGASAGVGSRLIFTPNLKGDFFVAKPLTRDVPSRKDNADDWRLKFSITSTF